MPSDIIHCVLHLQLRPFGERPVRRAQNAAARVENAVGRQGELVSLVTQQREPARLRHDQVENISVDHQVAAPVGAFVNRVLDDLDAAEMRAVVAAQEFVVIAGDVNYSRALACLPQQLLHHIVVGLRPIPGDRSAQPSTMSPTR